MREVFVNAQQLHHEQNENLMGVGVTLGEPALSYHSSQRGGCSKKKN
jgi:hypothetical protein